MHGVILKGLKDHVTDVHGPATWAQVIDDAAVEPKLYLPVTTYPADEWAELVETTVVVTGDDQEQLLANVGETVGPALLETFRAHVRPDWDALEAIASLESLFARLNEDETGSSPEVTCGRLDGAVDVYYYSGREECSLVEGLIRGIAAEYDESVTITPREDGPEGCRFLVEPA